MKRSITFEDLTHDELVRLSAAYDEIKNGAPVQGYDVAAATRAVSAEQAARNEQQAAEIMNEPNVTAPSPIADYQPKPALDSAIEIDAVGVPYNGEFHSTSKQKTAAGEWRMRKGADKAGVKAWRDQHARAAVKAQLQASAPVAPQPFVPPIQPVIPVPTEPVEAPDYGTWYELFKVLWGDGRLNADRLAEMNEQARAIDASAYANDDQARGLSYQFMQKLVA